MEPFSVGAVENEAQRPQGVRPAPLPSVPIGQPVQSHLLFQPEGTCAREEGCSAAVPADIGCDAPPLSIGANRKRRRNYKHGKARKYNCSTRYPHNGRVLLSPDSGRARYSTSFISDASTGVGEAFDDQFALSHIYLTKGGRKRPEQQIPVGHVRSHAKKQSQPVVAEWASNVSPQASTLRDAPHVWLFSQEPGQSVQFECFKTAQEFADHLASSDVLLPGAITCKLGLPISASCATSEHDTDTTSSHLRGAQRVRTHLNTEVGPGTSKSGDNAGNKGWGTSHPPVKDGWGKGQAEVNGKRRSQIPPDAPATSTASTSPEGHTMYWVDIQWAVESELRLLMDILGLSDDVKEEALFVYPHDSVNVCQMRSCTRGVVSACSASGDSPLGIVGAEDVPAWRAKHKGGPSLRQNPSSVGVFVSPGDHNLDMDVQPKGGTKRCTGGDARAAIRALFSAYGSDWGLSEQKKMHRMLSERVAVYFYALDNWIITTHRGGFEEMKDIMRHLNLSCKHGIGAKPSRCQQRHMDPNLPTGFPTSAAMAEADEDAPLVQDTALYGWRWSSDFRPLYRPKPSFYYHDKVTMSIAPYVRAGYADSRHAVLGPAIAAEDGGDCRDDLRLSERQSIEASFCTLRPTWVLSLLLEKTAMAFSPDLNPLLHRVNLIDERVLTMTNPNQWPQSDEELSKEQTNILSQLSSLKRLLNGLSAVGNKKEYAIQTLLHPSSMDNCLRQTHGDIVSLQRIMRHLRNLDDRLEHIRGLANAATSNLLFGVSLHVATTKYALNSSAVVFTQVTTFGQPMLTLSNAWGMNVQVPFVAELQPDTRAFWVLGCFILMWLAAMMVPVILFRIREARQRWRSRCARY